MAKFVEFRDVEGDLVSVNIDQITMVTPTIFPDGAFIAFGMDRGVTVESDYARVMEVLRALEVPTVST